VALMGEVGGGDENKIRRGMLVVRCKKAAGRGFRMTMELSCNRDRDRGG
jgi:hypothetical protein